MRDALHYWNRPAAPMQHTGWKLGALPNAFGNYICGDAGECETYLDSVEGAAEDI